MEDNMNDEPFSKQNNFFGSNDQEEEVNDPNLNDMQQFDDFNENLNEVINSDQNLDREVKKGAFLSVDEENDDTNLKNSYKSEHEQLNKKKESSSNNNNNNNHANFISQKMEDDFENSLQYDSRIQGDRQTSNQSTSQIQPPAPPPPQNYSYEPGTALSPSNYDQDEEIIPINSNNYIKEQSKNVQSNQSQLTEEQDNLFTKVAQIQNKRQAAEKKHDSDRENQNEVENQKHAPQKMNQSGNQGKAESNPPKQGKQLQSQPSHENEKAKQPQQDHTVEMQQLAESHHKTKPKLEPLSNQQGGSKLQNCISFSYNLKVLIKQ